MINVNFDGAWIIPEDTGSWGFVLKDEERLKIKVKRSGIIINKEGSSNYAEYTALFEALKYLLEKNLQEYKIKIFGDNNMVINQVKGKWKIKKGKYLPVIKEVLPLLGRFKNISFTWIPREQNEEADELTNEELSKVGLKQGLYYGEN